MVCLLAFLVVACGEDRGTEAAGEVAAALASGPADAEAPFVIGALDSLTGVGESYGIPLSRSKLLAVEEINAAGGINGRMLKLVIEDSKCTSTDAIAAYQRLTDVEGVKIILGATCSGATLGAAPLAEKDGVILFSPSATSPDITGAGDYIFRTAISSQKAGTDVGNLLWASGVRTIVTISEATDYAEGSRRAAVAEFERLGGQGGGGGELSLGRDRLSQSTLEAAACRRGRDVPGRARRDLRWHHHQAGPRAGLRRSHLLGSGAHGAQRPGNRRRACDGPESHCSGSRAEHFDRHGVPDEVQGPLRRRCAVALVPGLGLRRRLHRRRVPAADR